MLVIVWSTVATPSDALIQNHYSAASLATIGDKMLFESTVCSFAHYNIILSTLYTKSCNIE